MKEDEQRLDQRQGGTGGKEGKTSNYLNHGDHGTTKVFISCHCIKLTVHMFCVQKQKIFCQI